MLCQRVYRYILSKLLYAPIAAIHYTFCPIHGVLHRVRVRVCWRPPRLLISIRGPRGSSYQIRAQSYCWLFHKQQMLWQRLLCVRSEVNASHKTTSELNNWVTGCTQCGPRYRNLSVAFGNLERGRGNPSLLYVMVQDCIDFQVYWEPIHHHQWQTFHEMIPGESKLQSSFPPSSPEFGETVYTPCRVIDIASHSYPWWCGCMTSDGIAYLGGLVVWQVVV